MIDISVFELSINFYPSIFNVCCKYRDISFLYDAVSFKKSSIGSPFKSSVIYASGTKEINNEAEIPGMQSQDKSEADQHHEMETSKILGMVRFQNIFK